MNMIPLIPPVDSETRVSLLDMELNDLTEFIKELGQPAYRARQIWVLIY